MVEICSEEACSACRAKATCSMGNDGVRTAVVPNHSFPLTIGQEVNVSIKRTAGMKAVLTAYAVPIVLIVVSLLVLQATGINELNSGLITLGVVALYYIVLRLFRRKVEHGIAVELETES